MKDISWKDIDFGGINKDNLRLLNEFEIIHANDSGDADKDSKDKGLGSVALRIKGSRKKAAVIYGIRGTEPDDDILNDADTNAT